MTDLNISALRATRHAAALRQITDQMEWDGISRARDQATRLLALGAYDLAPDYLFEGLLDALEGADEAIEDALEPEDGLAGGWLARYRKRKKKRKAKRKTKRIQRHKRIVKRRKKRKEKKDRKKVGVSGSINPVDTEAAAAASGEVAPAEGAADVPGEGEIIPFYKKPIFIAGAGLAGAVVVGLLFMGGKKKKTSKEAGDKE